MKILSLALLLLLTGVLIAKKGSGNDTLKRIFIKVYQFNLNDLSGEPFQFKQLEGKVVLIVNVASKCGFTNQYEELQKIYSKYKDQGLVVLGIPSNDFGNQEPGSSKDIQSFCSMNYNVISILEKSVVKGKNAIPLYKFLTSKKYHPSTGGAVSWNFNKFLVDKNGHVVKRFSSFTKPESKKVVTAIEQYL